MAGVAFGVRCYMELRTWARLCQRGRIGIAYRGRVQLNAPLTEWLGWMRLLKDDEKSTGRPIYKNGKVSVFILYTDKEDTTTVKTIETPAQQKPTEAAA